MVAALPAIEAALVPLGVRVGPKRVHVYHKTHTAGGLDLVPMSGGVFQLMVELEHVETGVEDGTFMWNVVDLECDWKTAKPGGEAAAVEVVDDTSAPEHGLRLLSAAALREDLNGRYQPSKELRRRLKREYWDWAVANSSGGGGR